eukprot:COSAG06_NODE_40357_length_402_cov_1.914191_2_plen_70_part_01
MIAFIYKRLYIQKCVVFLTCPGYAELRLVKNLLVMYSTENARFVNLKCFLCVSRACLGKVIVYVATRYVY